MKKFNQIFGCVAIGLAMVFTGCESLDLTPEDNFSAYTFWKDEHQVDGYMTGLHHNIRSGYGNWFFMGEIRNGLLGDGDDGSSVSVFGESMNYQTIIKQQLRENNALFSNWNGIYAYIVRVNHAIIELQKADFLDEATRAYYLGQAYGMRAYYYFLLYQTWGGVPLVTDYAIVDGEVTAARLSRPRAKASEIMNLLKTDINESEKQFKAYGGETFYDKYVWSLDATLMLKANIYAWAAKVATGDQQATGNSDLQVAREAVKYVIDSGKFQLMPEFYQAFRSDYKDSNKENIFCSPFNKVDKVYFPNCSSALAQAGFFTTAYDLDGKALNYSSTAPYGNRTLINGIVRYQYKETFWRSFDEGDARRDATFFAVKGDATSEATGANFGVLLKKFAGTYDAAASTHYLDCDGPIYRYAEALLLMAEIENDLGNDPSPYINQIRARAYGDGYPAYANQSKYENSKAILAEIDKEFVFEGKRWFALLRLQGANNRPLVFDASVNYPFIPGTTQTPILSESEAYKMLWPISVSTNTNDRALEQTPGYESSF